MSYQQTVSTLSGACPSEGYTGVSLQTNGLIPATLTPLYTTGFLPNTNAQASFSTIQVANYITNNGANQPFGSYKWGALSTLDTYTITNSNITPSSLWFATSDTAGNANSFPSNTYLISTGNGVMVAQGNVAQGVSTTFFLAQY